MPTDIDPETMTTLVGVALVTCFALFTVIAIRLAIVGRDPYREIARVPLDDQRIVEPRRNGRDSTHGSDDT